MNALQTTAAGILDSAAREYRAENLATAESVQLCSEAYADRMLTEAEAEQVRASCLAWIAADDLDTITYDRMIASLDDDVCPAPAPTHTLTSPPHPRTPRR